MNVVMAGVDRNFHHPYKPYDIQNDFMNAVYNCIEHNKVGIIESPTGTGKSLSLICGALTWLREFKRRDFEDSIIGDDTDKDEPTWVIEHARERKRKEIVGRKADMEARLARIRAKEERARKQYESGEPAFKRQKTVREDNGERDAEDDFLLNDYESDDANQQKPHKSTTTADTGLSAETQALMEKIGVASLTKKDVDEPAPDELKIYFCSRTHSQLSQFADELRKVKFPPSIPPDPGGGGKTAVDKEDELTEEVKHLTLGSRKNLCINPKVSRLGNDSTINERCLELQQSNTPTDQKCPFLPKKGNEALVNDFRDHTLAKVRDIEDMGAVGKGIGICPYYASRASINPAEIVTLPYPLLLQKSAREALNLSLKNQIVVIDEAHNLMDAITSIHSCSLSLQQIQLARSQLGGYLQRFRNRLKGKNRVYITQLVRLIDSLAVYLEKCSNSTKQEGLVAVHDLMSGKGCDQINLFKLMHYLQESKLARKVGGYTAYTEQVATTQKAKMDRVSKNLLSKSNSSSPVLMHVQSFLLALTHPTDEGRFFYQENDDSATGGIRLQYSLLDPTYHFREIVEEARAVILAGGTMSPIEDYTEHLFSYIPLDRVFTLSCGHVIPKSNLMANPVVRGPNGVEFDFTFEKRKSDSMIRELGQAILEFTKVIPDGVVVFFPSYAYLNTAMKHWQASKQPSSTSLWDALSKQKRIFIEPKSNQVSSTTPSTNSNTKDLTTTDALLTAYSSHIHSPQDHTSGALLLAVIGGSLSEGINFSDRLGRGVIVVGLPFPNPYASEWAAKLKFISQRPGRGKHSANQLVAKEKGQEAARNFTLNTTMRAVNQSIGRAIRHKNDYASILLLDRRYDSARVRDRLPGWIKESYSNGNRGFREVIANVNTFFTDKKKGV